MDKCPKCNGSGFVPTNVFGVNGAIKCDFCDGTGVFITNAVEPMTNEEWLHTLNTEQLADLMSRMVGCSNCPIPKDGRNCMGTYSGCWHEIIKWLKQPHHNE